MLTKIIFDKRSFLKTVVLYLVLSFFWTYLCIEFDEFTSRDKGLVSGVGYLAFLSISIFFGQGLKGIPVLIYLMGIIGFTFLFASFGIGLLIALTVDSEILYAIVNSVFVAVAMTFGLNRAVRIDFKFYTIILTFILLFFGYVIITLSKDFFSHNFDFSPRIVVFSVFQIALILPLALGMAAKKSNRVTER